MKKCAALVGGTGFIGSHFIRQHIGSFDKIIAIDVRPTTTMISDILNKYKEKIEIVGGDVSELQDLIDAFKLCDPVPDQVYMLAALLPRECERSPNRAFRVNVYGLHNVLEASRIVGAKRVVFASSRYVYSIYRSGRSTASEEDPVDPITIYGATKVMGEVWGVVYARRYGMRFKSLRIPPVIGPGRADGGIEFISLAIQKAAQGESYTIPVSPSSKIPVIYVKDAVRALKEVIELDTPSNIYNITGVEPTPSVEDIVKVIKEFIPDAIIGFSPNESYEKLLVGLPEQLDDSRARREWGWKPLYGDLRALVRDFIAEVRLLPNIYRV